jgi:hypothetical protein
MLNDFKKWMEEAGTSTGSVASVPMMAGMGSPIPRNYPNTISFGGKRKKKRKKFLEGNKNEISPRRVS